MSELNEMLDGLRALAYPQKSHKNAGRKRLPLELRSPNRRFMLWINPALEERVRKIGDGSRSRGIEILWNYYQKGE